MEDCINREDVTEKATQDESIVDVRLTQPGVQGVTRHKPAYKKRQCFCKLFLCQKTVE